MPHPVSLTRPGEAYPDWLSSALEHAPERGFVEVEGAQIETLAWGDIGKPGILLVHGARAHADWWSYLAPMLAEEHRVVALSLSGMGGSDWRDAYSTAQYAREALAVAEGLGVFASRTGPHVIGHSFGGIVALSCAAQFGDRFQGAVVIDSAIRVSEFFRGNPGELASYQAARPNKIYPTLEAAISRFRLAPEQPCDNPQLVRLIAERSLRRLSHGEGGPGWTWRFDPNLFSNRQRFDPAPAISGARCPLAFIYGENSKIMTREVLDYALSLARGSPPVIEIPAAQHHLIIDQPLAFITVVRTLLAAWPRAD